MIVIIFGLLVFFLLAANEVVSSRSTTLPLIPHHAHLRRLSKAQLTSVHLRHTGHRSLSAQQVDAAYQGYGTHYVDMWTGTPPQRQTLIIGTGSPGIGFPCSNCINCGDETHHVDRRFDETASMTFRTVYCGDCEVGHCHVDSTSPSGKCEMGFAYAEGSSWSGFEAKDMAYMGGPHDKALAKGEGDGEIHDDIDPDQAREYQFELDFICQTRLTGLFQTQLADGILGMDNSKNAYWHQAMRANISDASAFALCFARQPTASREGTEAGAFTLGGFDERLHNEGSSVLYTPFNKNERGIFDVDVKGIYLRKGGGGDSALSTNASLPIMSLGLSEAELNSGRVLIDSGTTDTYLPRKFRADFERVWKEMTSVPYHHEPIDLSEEELNRLPTVLFQLEGDTQANQKLGSSPYPLGTLGSAIPDVNRSMAENFDVVVSMPASHYMEYKNGRYINRLYIDDAFDSTLGANFMMGHDIVFEIETGRLGWAESTCDYLSLLDKFGEPNPWERPGEDDGGKGKDTSGSGGTNATHKNDSKQPDNGLSGGNDSDGHDEAKSGGSTGTTVVIVVAATLGITSAAFYGKKRYDQRLFGSSQYQVASSELELQENADPSDTFTSPSFTIT
jgi:hypothetical protein